MDDMDSLFAGMDFVNPLSFNDAEPPSTPSSSSAPLDLQDFSTQAPDKEEHGAELVSSHQISMEFDQKVKTHGHGIDSILAAYDSVPKVSHSFTTNSKLAIDATKTGVRRKRRSVKIGYGRTEDVDEARSTTSGQDDTASIGSAMDDQSISLAELESSAGRHMSNGDNGFHEVTSDNFEANQEEPFPNIQLDTSASNLHIIMVPSSDLSIIRDNVNEVSASSPTSKVSELDARCLKEAEGNHLTNEELQIVKDSREFSPTLPVLEAGDVSKEALCISSNDTSMEMLDEKARSLHTVSDAADPGSEMDVLELGIRVPLELSIGDKFDFIKKTVSKITEHLQQRIAAISRARKEAAQKRRQVAEKLASSSAKFKQVEEEIEAACEREDFEKAESLSEALVEAEKIREVILEEFRAAETDYDRYANEMQGVLQMQIRNEEAGLSLLEQLAHDADVAAEDLKKESGNKGKTKLDALTVEEEAVKVKKKKVMLEMKVVEEAKSELSCAIESSTKLESQEKQTLVEERGVLLQELDALLAAVRLKEVQIAEHNKKIEALDEKINSRVSGFQKESGELEADLEKHMSGLEALETESEGLIAQKLQVEAEMAQSKAAAEQLIVFSSTAKMEAQRLHDALQMRKAAAESSLTSKEKRLSLASMEKAHVEEAQDLRSRSSSLRTSLQELASEKIKLQQELLSINQQISLIEKRGPEIEAEKKMAAASRNFKEAARLAAEAKAFLARKEKLGSDLKRMTAGLEALNQDLESRMNELSHLDSQLQVKEKEVAKARCERLRLLAAATRDERDTAAELEDFEEAESLDMEAEAADREADELQRALGFEGEMYSRVSSRVRMWFVGGDPSMAESSSAEKREEGEEDGRCDAGVELADADL